MKTAILLITILITITYNIIINYHLRDYLEPRTFIILLKTCWISTSLLAVTIGAIKTKNGRRISTTLTWKTPPTAIGTASRAIMAPTW